MTLYLNVYVLIITSLISWSVVSTKNESTIYKRIFLGDDEEYTWSSYNYPNSYPKNASEDLIITSDVGYSIGIVIDKLDLDGFNGDILVVKPGISLEGLEEGYVFTFSIKTLRQYVIHSNSVYFSFQVHSDNFKHKQGFQVHYKRIGGKTTPVTAVTTSVSTLSNVTWITPLDSKPIYYIGHVHGKSVNDFNNNKTHSDLKAAISEMARKYCINNNINATDPISSENVQIKFITECPKAWSDYNLCARVSFAIPIVYQNDSVWNGYQLNADNLDLMWTKYADESLTNYGMKVYHRSSKKSFFQKLVVTFCVILVLFLMFLLAIKIACRYIFNYNFKKRRLSDSGTAMSQLPKKNKIILSPYPNQIIPPLFENNYSNIHQPNPASSRSNYNSYVGNQNFSFEDSDDSEDIEIYDRSFNGNHHNDIKHVNKQTNF